MENIYKLGIRDSIFNFIDNLFMGVLSGLMWRALSPQLLIWKMGFPRDLSLLQHFFSIHINDLAMAMTGNQK